MTEPVELLHMRTGPRADCLVILDATGRRVPTFVMTLRHERLSRYGEATCMGRFGRQWCTRAQANTERCKAKARAYFERIRVAP